MSAKVELQPKIHMFYTKIAKSYFNLPNDRLFPATKRLIKSLFATITQITSWILYVLNLISLIIPRDTGESQITAVTCDRHRLNGIYASLQRLITSSVSQVNKWHFLIGNTCCLLCAKTTRNDRLKCVFMQTTFTLNSSH